MPPLTAQDLQSKRDAIAGRLGGRCQIVRRAVGPSGGRTGAYTDIRATDVPCEVNTPELKFLDFAPYVNNTGSVVETKAHRLITLAYGPLDANGHTGAGGPYDVIDGDRIIMLTNGTPDPNWIYDVLDCSVDETNPTLFMIKANHARVNL